MCLIEKRCPRCLNISSFRVYNSGVQAYCINCWKEYSKTRNTWKNKYNKEYRINNVEKVRARDRARQVYKTIKQQQRYKEDPGFKKRKLEALEYWKINNPEVVKALQAEQVRRRQAAKLKRCPLWLTKEDKVVMRGFYAVAKLYNSERLDIWEVDHVIPLQGTLVSGLHVPWNLQLITRSDNRKKAYKFEV